MAAALSLDLSVLETPFAVTVTEQVIKEPEVDAGIFQELEVMLEVTVSEVCAIPLMSRL